MTFRKNIYFIGLQLIPTSDQPSITRVEMIAKCQIFPKQKEKLYLKSLQEQS
jgi:hypothetical protein